MITLKNLAEATEQEIFDQVTNHLLIQKVKSTKKGSCCYRMIEPETNRILKCAAGCLIADDEYKPEMDSCSDSGGSVKWFTLTNRFKIVKNHHEFISRLQQIHDAYDPEQWKEKLQQFARLKELQFNFNGDDNT